MKIMHIGHMQRKANGVGQVINALTKSQRDLGHEVLPMTARKKLEPLDLYVEVENKKKFINLLDEFKPDIFIFHSLYIWKYIGFYKILRNRNIPFMIQLHGALSEENYRKNHFKKYIANKLFYNSFIKAAENIIYLNDGEYNKSIVKDINPNYSIIPNGCKIPEDVHVLGRDTNKKVEILYLGRIDIHHKALDILTEAIEIVGKSDVGPEIHTTFYGIGEDSQIIAFKKLLHKIENLAEFRGAAYGELKDQAYKNADIFILTSRYEGMPMAILEALSYGCPCIITEETNMASVILNNKCGWVTKLYADTIANTIISAVKDYKENKETYCRSSITASKLFSWKSVADISIEIYEQVIRNYKHHI